MRQGNPPIFIKRIELVKGKPTKYPTQEILPIKFPKKIPIVSNFLRNQNCLRESIIPIGAKGQVGNFSYISPSGSRGIIYEPIIDFIERVKTPWNNYTIIKVNSCISTIVILVPPHHHIASIFWVLPLRSTQIWCKELRKP